MCYYNCGECGMNIVDSMSNDFNDNNDLNNGRKRFINVLIVILCIILGLVLFFVYIRYGATSGLKVHEYKVTDSLVPSNFHGFKIVQFSDIHYGNTVDLDYLEKIIDGINDLKPDVVFFTGDLLDKEINYDERSQIISVLSGISAKVGKYAISGDSDYDLSLFNDIITASGFVDLDGTSDYIYYNGSDAIFVSNSDEAVLDGVYSIYLVHKPDDVLVLNNSFDLVLAGHSLNGQINLPFLKNLFLPDGARTYYDGHYVVNNMDLYVSGGIGTTNLKVRFLNRPSVNLYRLTSY